MAVQAKVASLRYESDAAVAIVDTWICDEDREAVQAAGRPATVRRTLAGRALLRFLLAGQSGSSGLWSIGPDERGKPFATRLSGEPGPGISVSHSAGIVIAALSADGDVGVDIECRSRRRSVTEIAQFAFGPREAAAAAVSDAAFYRIWTLREALAKANGAGLKEAADRCDRVADAPACGTWAMLLDGRWHYLLSHPLVGTFSLALAVRAPVGDAQDIWTPESVEFLKPQLA